MEALRARLALKLGAVTEDAGFEAGVILEEAFGRDWRLKSLRGGFSADESMLDKAEKMAERRLKGEPLQYIVGEWEFFGMTFKVAPGALIPRQDTESLVLKALELIKDAPSPKVVDLCSGTGCVAAAIKKSRPDADVAALELYPAAYEILCENARRHNCDAPFTPVMGDALSNAVASRFHGIDLITANPPYLTESDMRSLQREVTFEPKEALFGGADGLRFYRELPKVWRNCLKPGGAIAFEIGLGQEGEVLRILEEQGFSGEVSPDLTGRARVVSGKLKG